MPSLSARPDRPCHFEWERDAVGMQLVTARGMETAANLKLAHWRGQFDLVRTPPTSDYHVLTYVLGGSTIHCMDRHAAPARTRSVVFQPSQSSASWTSDGPTEYVQLYLRVATIDGIANDVLPRPTRTETQPDLGCYTDARFASMVAQCAATLAAEPHVSPLELDGWAQVIGAYFLRTQTRLATVIQDQGGGKQPHTRIEQAMDLIEATLDRDISLADLAAICDLSQWHFSRLFKQATGSSPHRYILNRRIDRAAERLCADRSASLAQIALETGFCSQAHLTTAFKQRMGVTPGRYRRDRAS